MTTIDRTFRTLTGALTVAYGAAALTHPPILLKPAGLTEDKDNRRLVRALGVRDVLSGTSLLLTPPPLAAFAVTARVLADVSDVALFGVRCPDRAKVKAVSVAAGWGLLCSLGHPAFGQLVKKVSA